MTRGTSPLHIRNPSICLGLYALGQMPLVLFHVIVGHSKKFKPDIIYARVGIQPKARMRTHRHT